jgi:hypothetical protein
MSKEVNGCLLRSKGWNTEFNGERFTAFWIEIGEVLRWLYALLRLIKDKFDLW